ncbi:MAG: zinc ribbon domain-containing protein [Candidatus Hermodarchaeota archaeon]
MNYCPNCGTPVESDWKVCANCGHRLLREQISILPQKKPETQIETVEVIRTKPYPGYFEPQKTNGIVAFSFGIMGIGLSFLIMILRSYGYRLAPLMITSNAVIILSGTVAFIFGIIGCAKDDSKALAVLGLLFGIGSFLLLLIRYLLYLYASMFPIID